MRDNNELNRHINNSMDFKMSLRLNVWHSKSLLESNFVQVLNTGKGHWVTISTIWCEADEVDILTTCHDQSLLWANCKNMWQFYWVPKKVNCCKVNFVLYIGITLTQTLLYACNIGIGSAKCNREQLTVGFLPLHLLGYLPTVVIQVNNISINQPWENT